ncbi:hypothetical protein MLOOGBEN_06980 [Bacillus sp. EB106-08-02-XG196]|jgi:hypothetical protein|uniref:hypothetical protein n=1 Tax=Bacillus sp. EB106-08-02-XG196 TaxID=2737049 RepID=UPI0015C471BA|nr:hypothetical protein [Bacillus sp. EB106-08-02-XG196]NWQ40441.1 hypothetical protein [Bacillus sp. EB106-08-02-XG196]
MSFADFNDIYLICSTYEENEQSVDMVKLGRSMTSSPSVTEVPLTSSTRWWEVAEKEIQREKREKVTI